MAQAGSHTVVLIDDDERIREEIKGILGKVYPAWTLKKAGNMEEARKVLEDNWPDVSLAVVDMMLPRNPDDAKKLADLVMERETAYTKWLEVTAELPLADPKCMMARFAVEAFDKEIFERLDVEGGFSLIDECKREINGGKKVDKAIVFLSARENSTLRGKSMGLVVGGKAEWLVKPVESRQVLESVTKILKQ